MTTHPTPKRSGGGDAFGAILLTVVLAVLIGVAVHFAHGGTSACRSQWEHSAAHSYQSYADYQRNVCNGVPLPAPADPADLPSN